MEFNRKKILLVCNYFAPENAIAAVRTTKLVKYLMREGFDVDVITEKKDKIEIDEMLKQDAEGVQVYYTENSDKCKKICAYYQKFIKPYREKRMMILDNRERINRKTGNVEFYPFETAYPVLGSLDYIFEQARQKDLAREVEKFIRKLGRYDWIITSYGDSFAYFVGKAYKKLYKDVKWIFDIRDAIYRYKFIPDLVRWIPLRYEEFIWKNADAIVGVSHGICNRVPMKYKDKVHYISNGYDDSDVPNIDTRLSTKMSFTYTGSMYGGLQNLSVFFVVLRKLIDENVFTRNDVEVHYAGKQSAYEIFKSQAKKEKLDEICIYHGRISRKKSMELQRQSDILLLASNDYKDNNRGVITGKLPEYMAACRPVIAIVTGDIENSEVRQIINKTNIGICYEESNKEEDIDRLEKYIYQQYFDIKNNGVSTYRPVESEKVKFKYSEIVQKYIRLIYKLKGEKK